MSAEHWPEILANWPRALASGALPVLLADRPDSYGELLRAAGAAGLRVLPVGVGDVLDEPVACAGFDLAVRADWDTKLVAYEPGEAVVTVTGNYAWAELERRVAAEGQQLSPWLAGRKGTVAGVLARGLSGLDRGFYGGLRHQVLGMRVLLSDGTQAQVGGRLVKNVAGFDLPRLFAGSAGRFGVILEASLRTFPRPAVEEVWDLGAHDLDRALLLCERLHTARLPGAQVLWQHSSAAEVHLHLWVRGSAGACSDTRRVIAPVAGVQEVQRGKDAQTWLSTRARAWSSPAPGPCLQVLGSAPDWWRHGAAFLRECPVSSGLALPGTFEARFMGTEQGWSPSARLHLQNSPFALRWLKTGSAPVPELLGRLSPGVREAQEKLRGAFDPSGTLSPDPEVPA
ncbi:MAG: FAD-binding protein [Planctomycetota bacterium]